MPKAYEKDGDFLKEVETKELERRFTLKQLRSEKQSIMARIDELQAEKAAVQALIDEAVKLNIKE